MEAGIVANASSGFPTIVLHFEQTKILNEFLRPLHDLGQGTLGPKPYTLHPKPQPQTPNRMYARRRPQSLYPESEALHPQVSHLNGLAGAPETFLFSDL